jgi:hypothetical protein
MRAPGKGRLRRKALEEINFLRKSSAKSAQHFSSCKKMQTIS